MATATVTPSTFAIVNTNQIKHVFAGDEIPIATVVYRSGGTDGQYHIADADALSTAPQDLDGSEYGITLNEAPGAGAPLAIARSGAQVTLGAGAMFDSFTYYADQNSALNSTQPPSGDYGIVVGVAIDSSTLAIRFQASGVATP